MSAKAGASNLTLMSLSACDWYRRYTSNQYRLCAPTLIVNSLSTCKFVSFVIVSSVDFRTNSGPRSHSLTSVAPRTSPSLNVGGPIHHSLESEYVTVELPVVGAYREPRMTNSRLQRPSGFPRARRVHRVRDASDEHIPFDRFASARWAAHNRDPVTDLTTKHLRIQQILELGRPLRVKLQLGEPEFRCATDVGDVLRVTQRLIVIHQRETRRLIRVIQVPVDQFLNLNDLFNRVLAVACDEEVVVHGRLVVHHWRVGILKLAGQLEHAEKVNVHVLTDSRRVQHVDACGYGRRPLRGRRLKRNRREISRGRSERGARAVGD